MGKIWSTLLNNTPWAKKDLVQLEVTDQKTWDKLGVSIPKKVERHLWMLSNNRNARMKSYIEKEI